MEGAGSRLPSGTVTFLFTDVEVGTEGDAFFVAFGRAGDAVNAAIDGQRAIETYVCGDPAAAEQRRMAQVGDALGPEPFDAAFATGKRMSMDEAVAYALEVAP